MGVLTKKKKKDKQEMELVEMPNQTDIMSALMQPPDEKTDLSKVVDQLINTDNESYILERLTELDQSQINSIAILLEYSEKYEITVLKGFIYKYLSLMFSKNRHSRSEIVDMFKQHQPDYDFGGGGKLGALMSRVRR